MSSPPPYPHNSTQRLIVDVPEAWADHVEKTLGDIQDSMQNLRSELQEDVTAGVVAAVKELLRDKQVSEQFWKTGYDSLAEHSANGASQWIGKRILTAFIVAITTAGIIWLVKTGALK